MSTSHRGLPETRDFTPEDAGFMRMAIELSTKNIDEGGGPFGAVIVKDGKVIATGTNRVVPNNDPTAHAEVTAIRAACSKLGTFNLEGCTIYSSCEPCPMCLSAIYWAGISKLCYGNTKKDAAKINFSDAFIYDELGLPYLKRKLKCVHFLGKEAIKAFRIWDAKQDKVPY